jgi:hypothetical protein
MYITFFLLLFLLAVGAFAISIFFKEPDTKLIFSIVSTITFLLTAIASFGVEIIDSYVVGSEIVTHTTILYSYSFAGVCILFAVISIITSLNNALYFLRKPTGDINERTDINQ